MKDNIYFNDSPYLWNMLKSIVDQHKCNYGKVIASQKYSQLHAWINESLPQLALPTYHISTKCFWILNGLVDFPKCSVCGEKLTNRNASVSLGYKHRASDTCLYCSVKCARNSSLIKDKAKTTRLKHFTQYQPLDFKEKVEMTKQQHFGDPHFNNREKAKSTLLSQTGYDHNWKNPSCRHKCSSTYKKNTGYDQPLANPQVIEQSRQTKAKKYGSETYNNPKKAQQTAIENYGVSHHMKLLDFQHKVENTKRQKYGYAHFNVEQSKKTMLERYGKEYASQVHEIRLKQQQKYSYHGISFDSLPELAYYIWLKDNKMKFVYQPNIQLKYMFNETVHFYMPDFDVDGQLVELKGNHFFKDGNPLNEMVCPWDHSLDALYEAKRQCMLANDVKILATNDYVQYIKYVNTTYGKAYLKQFKSCSKNI